VVTLPARGEIWWGEGLPVDSVAAFDGVTVFPRSMLVRRIGGLRPARIGELCDALAAATDR
jgi:mRNA-degrading endonuclease toxin of MazEF toxin-antitoxin module